MRRYRTALYAVGQKPEWVELDPSHYVVDMPVGAEVLAVGFNGDTIALKCLVPDGNPMTVLHDIRVMKDGDVLALPLGVDIEKKPIGTVAVAPGVTVILFAEKGWPTSALAVTDTAAGQA